MKEKINSITILLLLFVTFNYTKAQDKGQFSISTGCGVSGIAFFQAPNENSYFEGGNNKYQFTAISPVYNGNIEYGVSHRISIGVGLAYQYMIGNYDNSPYPDHISRLNTGIKCTYHIMYATHSDFYISIRLSTSFWKDIYNNPTTNTYFSGWNYNPFLTVQSFKIIDYQALIGYRYYIVPHIGIFGELGIGSPYFASGGVTFRIGKLEQ